ncbi:MAG: TonB-dependent receptor [Opitutaceae bacterium]|nr:TonB-dependent receptor [Opitutaceae bacterium]
MALNDVPRHPSRFWPLLVAVLFVAASPAAAAAGVPMAFDLPAGEAAVTLKRFGAQAKREIMFPAAAVAGVRTHAVQGEFTPRAALELMIARTGLTAAEDDLTGALMIFRAVPAPAAPQDSKPDPKPKPPDPPMTRKTPLALLGALLAAVIAPAQNAPASATASDAAKTEAIMLSEFRVDTSKDRGYLATNATTGTRLNMAIKDIPLPVEVITREFIEDIGAFDIKEALDYSAGIVQETVTTSNNFTFSPSGSGNAGSVTRDTPGFTVRGLNTRSFLRSGFRQDTVTDNINVDRMEVARGPQALLYGVASLGGVVNIAPRYPRATPRQDLRLGYGSFGFARAELYATGNLLRKNDGKRTLNYGIGLVAQAQSRPDELNDRTRVLVTPALDFRVFENTNIFVDMEYGRFRTEGNGFQDINDANAGNVRNEFGLRVAENVNIYNQTIGVARDRFGKGRFFRWSGKDHYQQDDYFSGTVEITQRLPYGLTAVAGANYADTHTTRRSIGGQGVSTQNTASPAITPTAVGRWVNVGPNPINPAQTHWKSVNYNWSASPTNKRIKQTRLDLSYEFTIFGNKQGLLLGRTDQSTFQVTRNTTQASSNLTGGTNQSYVAYGDLSHIAYAGEAIRPVNDASFQEWSTGHYAVLQSRWWRDRITILGGFRNDRYMVRDLQYDFAKANPALPDNDLANWVRSRTFNATAANSAPGAVPKVNGYRFGGAVQHEDGPTLGLSLKISEALSLYGAAATGVFPNTGQRDGNGNPFNAERSESRELGLKFDLFRSASGRSRVSGTVSVFKVDRENAIYNLFWAPQGRSNDRKRSRGFATAPVSGTGAGAYSVTNSGFLDFETSQPVTYLVPIGYVAPADLGSPRVTGAPQQSGFILVDYASLGSASTDPLRRALDAAAGDGGNLTALQTAAVGTGASGLYANNGYALNRNSDTAYNDRSKGVEAQIYLNFTDNLSTVITYTHLVQGITGGFKVADQARSTEYDSWWNYMGVPLDVRRANLDESSYDFSGQIKGARTSDNPRNSASVWNNYKVQADGWLRGFEIGTGVTWVSQRQSEVVINNGARDLKLAQNVRFKPAYPQHITVNAALGWRGTAWGRKWNLRLNVNNLLNDQKDAAFGSSTLFIDPATGITVPSATPGAQRISVPERVVRYFDPISFRFTASTSF